MLEFIADQTNCRRLARFNALSKFPAINGTRRQSNWGVGPTPAECFLCTDGPDIRMDGFYKLGGCVELRLNIDLVANSVVIREIQLAL